MALVTAATLRAQQSPSALPPSPDSDPFVGTWKTNTDLSRPKLDKREASYTRTIARRGDELVFTSHMDRSRKSDHDFRIRCDGKPYHVPEPNQTMACVYVATNVVRGTTHTPDGQTSHWNREVSTDGHRMTITSYKDEKLTKVKSVWVLDRIK